MPTTTADLFSIDTLNSLVVEPCFARSSVLPHLRRVDTRATTLYLPTVSGGSAYWTKELVPITDAGVAADELPVTPKKVAAIQTVSNEARQDANAAIIVGQALTDAVAKTVDAAFVNGGGTDGPTGLPGVVGPSTVDADPATLNAYVDAIAAIQTAGGTPTVIFVSPADWAALQKLPANTGANVPALSPMTGANGEITRSLYGVPVSVVAALTAGTAWVLDGTRTVVVQRTPATLATSDGPLFTSDGYLVRVTMRLEFASCYAKTVCQVKKTTMAMAEKGRV